MRSIGNTLSRCQKMSFCCVLSQQRSDQPTVEKLNETVTLKVIVE